MKGVTRRKWGGEREGQGGGRGSVKSHDEFSSLSAIHRDPEAILRDFEHERQEIAMSGPVPEGKSVLHVAKMNVSFTCMLQNIRSFSSHRTTQQWRSSAAGKCENNAFFISSTILGQLPCQYEDERVFVLGHFVCLSYGSFTDILILFSTYTSSQVDRVLILGYRILLIDRGLLAFDFPEGYDIKTAHPVLTVSHCPMTTTSPFMTLFCIAYGPSTPHP